MRRLLVVACVGLLAACGSAPKKAPPPPPVAGASSPATPGANVRKVSPYAPAQEDLSKRGDYVAGGLYAPGIADSTPPEIPDVDAIPEPDVVDEPRSRHGNRSPYLVLGRPYHVLESPRGYVEEGLASYYGSKFHGRRTSNQEVYDMYAFTAAHKSLPLPSFARVTNLDNGRSVVVRVNDRGPFHDGRVIDLSYAAAVKLGVHPRGTGRVEVRGLDPSQAGPASPRAAQAAVDPATGLPPGVRIATGRPQAMPSTAIDTLVESLPAAGSPSPVAAPAPAPASTDWRFDMRQDGRAMSADEFDAWMKSRRVRVATGRPGVPDPRPPTAATIAAPPAVAVATSATGATTNVVPVPSQQAVDRVPTAPVDAPGSAPGVVLQVAAFGARDNAERALALLEGAGIAGGRLLAGTSGGRPVWRLRIGPLDSAGIAGVGARLAGLGFGAPQVVRD